MSGYYIWQQVEDRPAAGLALEQEAYGLNDDADENILRKLSCIPDNTSRQ